MKKTVKLFLRIALLLSLFLTVIVSALALRILYSPIGVPYATEMVESEADRLLPGWTVTFDQAEVGWGWSDVRPWVRLDNIVVKDPSGTVDAVIDKAMIAVSRSDILQAVLTMRSIEIDGLHLKVKMIETDTDFWSLLDMKQGPKALAPLVEATLRHSRKLNAGMMHLDSVNIQNIDAAIMDAHYATMVTLNIPTIDFAADDDYLNLAVNGFAQAGEDKIDLRLNARADIDNNQLSIDWDSDPVNIRKFTSKLTVPEFVRYLDAPVALALSLTANDTAGLVASDLYIEVGKGQLIHKKAFPVAADIGYLSAEAEFDKEHNSFLIKEISGAVKSHELRGEALLYFDEGIARPGIKADLDVSGLTIPDLKVYWPNTDRNTAKDWVVANMTTGTFSDVKFLVDVGSDGVGAYRDGSSFDLTFKFSGLDARYNKTLPIITEAEGFSHLTRTQFDLMVTSAVSDGMTLGASQFIVHDIHKRGLAYSLTDVHLEAPVEDILHFTAFAPISLNDRMKIGPERIKGYAITDTHLKIPLFKGVKFKDMEFTTRVKGSDVEVHNLLQGEGIRGGTVDLIVDKRGLKAEGDIKLNGISMHASWSEDFVKAKVEGADTTKFTLSGDMDAEDLLAFNVDISSFLDGKVPVEATFSGRKFQITDGHFTADITPGIINVAQMEWQKEAGRSALLSGSIKFTSQEVTISPLLAYGPDIDLSADLYWKLGENNHFKAGFDVRKLDDNSFSASLDRVGYGAYHATIAAKELDLRPFLDFQSQKKKIAEGEILKPSTVYLSLTADQAHLLNGVEATNLILQSTFTEDGPQESTGKAIFESGQNLDLSIFIEDNATRSVWVETQDAGAFLRGTGLFSHGLGGKITFDGQIQGWAEGLDLKGEARAEKMKVLPVGMLHEEATTGVISGIDEIVGDKGTDFDTLVVPFEYNKGLLDMNGLRAAGSSIGLTLEGQIDYNSQKINMNGVYVPVYGLNAAIGSIPIIGNILTGGKGQGIFGIAYRVKGMIDNPSVSINPLSGIAPGIFRRIFEGSKGKVADVKDQPLIKPEGTPEEETEGTLRQ